MLGDRHVQLGFRDEAERALRPARDAVQVEAAVCVADVGEVITRKRAVELGKALGDERAVLPLDLVHQPVHRSNPVGAGFHLGQRMVVEGTRGPDRAVEEHSGERQHVVARLAVETRALAARVGVDHAPDGGAVGGGELRREE